ncbi:MAG: WD40/YVTN/BNR-like repeat-containing protein, partial [Terriglobales bacterium]
MKKYWVMNGMGWLRTSWLLLLAISATAQAALPTPPGGSVRALAADPFHSGRVLLGTNTGGVFVSADAGSQWSFLSQVAPHDDWVVASLVPDPTHAGRWYAGLWSWTAPDGGVFVTDNGGQTWRALLQGHAVRALAQATSAPATLVAATLDGVYRSQDGGQDWERISPAHDRELTNIESVAIDPVHADEIYVGTWHLPWKTVNGGHDWWQMRQGVIDDSDVFSIAVDRAHAATVYLSACSGIYRSDDHGNHFRKIQGIPY